MRARIPDPSTPRSHVFQGFLCLFSNSVAGCMCLRSEWTNHKFAVACNRLVSSAARFIVPARLPARRRCWRLLLSVLVRIDR